MSNELNTNVITGLVRLNFPHLWEPSTVKGAQNTEKKYSCSLIISKEDTETINKIDNAVNNAIAKGINVFNNKIPQNLNLPLKDGDIEKPDDETLYKSYYISAKSKATNKPNIVDIDRNPILNQSEIYSGCWVIANINFYAYNIGGNKGIACSLNDIMKVKDGEPLSSRPSAKEVFSSVDVSQYIARNNSQANTEYNIPSRNIQATTQTPIRRTPQNNVEDVM